MSDITLVVGDLIKLKFHAMSDICRKNIKTFILPCEISHDNRKVVIVPKKNGETLSYEVGDETMKLSSDPKAKYESWFMSGFDLMPDEFFNSI